MLSGVLTFPGGLDCDEQLEVELRLPECAINCEPTYCSGVDGAVFLRSDQSDRDREGESESARRAAVQFSASMMMMMTRPMSQLSQ